jgi:prepilin-type N-terminal cleavage/methylation domain-containing protein
MTNNNQKGFTLIELLVVVAIIAILALIVMLAINPVEMARRSRDARRLSDLGTVRRALDLALADGAVLPGTPTTLYTAHTGQGGNILLASDVTNLVGVDISKYLATIPQDPMYKLGDATALSITDGLNCPSADGSTTREEMVYTFTSDGDTYELNMRLESKDNCEIPANDGGDDAGLYEVGTNLRVVPEAE